MNIIYGLVLMMFLASLFASSVVFYFNCIPRKTQFKLAARFVCAVTGGTIAWLVFLYGVVYYLM